MSGHSQYDSYHDTGSRWLGALPIHWQAPALKRFAKMRGGYAFSSEEFASTGVQVLKIANLYQGILDLTRGPAFVSPERVSQLPEFVVHQTDVLLSLTGTFAAVSVGIRGPFLLNQRVGLIEPQEMALLREYLLRVLSSPEYLSELHSKPTGTAQLNLSNDDVLNIRVPIPPLAEQAQIAKFLDYETLRIDALIEKQQQLIALLKEKRQAVISHAVTKGLNPDAPMRDSGVEWLGEVPAHWEVAPVKWATRRLQTGCTPPTEQERFYRDGCLPWFGPSSFGEPLVVGAPVKLLNECAVAEGKARSFSKGTVLIVGIGATIGKSALTNVRCSSNQQIIALEFFPDKVLADFAALSVRCLEEVFRDRAQYTTMPIMNQAEIGIYKLAIPPLEEQQGIVRTAHAAIMKSEELVRSAQEIASLLQERRTALISAAVTGKIDVRGWKAPDSKPQAETA